MKSKLIVFFSLLTLIGLFIFAVNNSELHNEPEEETGENQPASFTNLSAQEALAFLKDNSDTFVVDVHTPEQEHLAGTDAFIPFEQVTDRLSEFPQDKSTPILVYCRSGSMSLDASNDLIDLGYTNVYNLAGGIHAWTGAGNPLNWRQDTN